jgi:hypothetical protein
VGCVPLETARLKAIKQDKSGPKKLLFAARTNATKHPDVILAVYDALYQQGEDVEVRYVTQSCDFLVDRYNRRYSFLDGREHIQLTAAAPPAVFFEHAAQSPVYMCWSDSESYSISVVEAVMLGCVLVCWDKPCFRASYDPHLSDHFWAVDEADAIEKVRWVVRNYEEAYSMQAGLRAMFLQAQVDRNVAKHIDTKLEELLHLIAHSPAVHWSGMKEPGELALTILKTGFSLPELLGTLSSMGHNFITSNLVRAKGHKLPVDWQLHQVLKHKYGYRDECTKRHPVYLKD